MKAYLEGATLVRQDRSKTRLKKESVKHRQPSPSFGSKVIRLATANTEGAGQCGTDRRRKNHQRTKTDVFDKKVNKVESGQVLNKTHSKTKLKSELSSYNSKTVKVVHNDKIQKTIDLDVNPLWGVVKQRLTNDCKSKKTNSNNSVKKLIELTQQAKRKDRSFYKNPEEVLTRKQLQKSMELHVNNIRQQVSRQKKVGRQIELCDALKEMVNYAQDISHGTEHRQGRLLNRVRQLEDRNVRLMCLMNKLKKEGVNVDSFWFNYD